jgi:uncharacterized membrane protein
MRVGILAAIILLAFSATVSAAEIYGKVYRWDTLDVLNNAVVEIKDGSIQRMISENGEYSFNVTPGNYTIVAYAGELYAVENVTVDGSMRFDLILFPSLEEIEELPDFATIEQDEGFPYYIIAILASGLVLAVLFLIKRSEKRPSPEPVFESQEVLIAEESLPEDLAEVVELIRREGGRITQKELRKKLGYSEAKMSLIIADLERRGIVEKVKKGRGNIISSPSSIKLLRRSLILLSVHTAITPLPWWAASMQTSFAPKKMGSTLIFLQATRASIPMATTILFGLDFTSSLKVSRSTFLLPPSVTFGTFTTTISPFSGGSKLPVGFISISSPSSAEVSAIPFPLALFSAKMNPSPNQYLTMSFSAILPLAIATTVFE